MSEMTGASPLAEIERNVQLRAKRLALDNGARLHIVHGDIGRDGHILVNIRKFCWTIPKPSENRWSCRVSGRFCDTPRDVPTPIEAGSGGHLRDLHALAHRLTRAVV